LFIIIENEVGEIKSMSIHNIKGSELNNIIKNNDVVLVDFWAPWCGPCIAFGRVLEEFAAENTNIKVVKINVDDNQEIARNYKIMSIPTIIYFVKGVQIKTLIGGQTKKTLIDLVSHNV